MTFPSSLDALVTRALEEDLSGGDITTEATIDPHTIGLAEAVAKSPLVVSGGEVFARTFYAVSPGCRVVRLVEDGTFVEAGTVLFQVEGRARELLMAERTALNFMQRLSGTATLTKRFVDAAKGKCRIADTRKTTPLFRALERQAVRDGGGHNHRDCLGSAVMIKDNHIAACGGITQAVEAARTRAPHTCKIEVEVTNLNEVREALAARADILLLDNFGDDITREAIAICKGKALVELSGNMTLERVTQLASLGADVISIGALTHSAPAADISLRIRPVTDDAPGLPNPDPGAFG
jgi:nicotinate-nucleotide pyrophosphorylase (carboxylating)